MWGGDGEAELPQAQIWFRGASPGALPRAEPPAAVYKAWRPDRRDEDLNPPAEESCSGHGELHSHFPPPNPCSATTFFSVQGTEAWGSPRSPLCVLPQAPGL